MSQDVRGTDRLGRMAGRAVAVALLGTGLAACQDSQLAGSGRGYRPISSEMQALFVNKGTDAHKPMLIRTFKKEAELEIWKMRGDGKYVLVKTFPMCRWSGQLGPKTREGDRQVPEGFYSITPGQMNPNSSYYLSFNVGYPNALDKTLGHTGGLIMVHGACSSAGCFSMTDAQIADIYAVARESFGGGQRAIQMESFPFRMTAENLAKHRLDPNIGFWKNLKEGSDHFEVTKTEPAVGVCGRKYVFNATAPGGMDAGSPCPALKQDPEIKELVAEKQRDDDRKVAELVEKGVQPIRTVYADGGQHPDFANRSGDVSRPDALAAGATEIAMAEPKVKSNVVKVAAAKAEKAKAGGASELAKAESTAPKAPDMTPTATAYAAPAHDSKSSAATSTIANWMGFKKDEPKAVEPPPVEPVTASVPVPPKRGAAAKPQVPATKPQASLTNQPFYGAGHPAAKDFVALQPVRP